MGNKSDYMALYRARHRATNELTASGFIVVRISGDYPWSLLAVKEDEVRLVQVKRCKEPGDANAIIKKAISELIGVKVPVSAFQSVWIWVDQIGFTKREVPWRGQ